MDDFAYKSTPDKSEEAEKYKDVVRVCYNGTTHYIKPSDKLEKQDISDRIDWFRNVLWFFPKEIDDMEFIYCLVGNIVDEHPFGEDKEIRRGTKQFAPGAKVYVYPPRSNKNYGNIQVIGKPRKKNTMITVFTKIDYITNWRLKKVFDPFVITEMVRDAGWDNTDDSKKRIEEYIDFIKDEQD